MAATSGAKPWSRTPLATPLLGQARPMLDSVAKIVGVGKRQDRELLNPRWSPGDGELRRRHRSMHQPNGDGEREQ